MTNEEFCNEIDKLGEFLPDASVTSCVKFIKRQRIGFFEGELALWYFTKKTIKEANRIINQEEDDGIITIDEKNRLEYLAEIEHDQWAHWTRYMLDNLTDANIKRWRQQIETPYCELSEKEKDSDRVWARKALRVINKEEEKGSSL